MRKDFGRLPKGNSNQSLVSINSVNIGMYVPNTDLESRDEDDVRKNE